MYCQWYLLSKHNSTHTKRVCYIIIWCRVSAWTLLLQASLSHHLIDFVYEWEVCSIPYGRYLWGVGITAVNTTLCWASAILRYLLPFMWTNMSARGTLPWILVQGPKGFSNFEKKYMSTNVDFYYMILGESMKFVEMYLFLLTPCDFLR